MLLLKNIEYISTPDRYIIKIECNSNIFIIPINKSIISKHICSIEIDSIKDDLGMDVWLSEVSVSYTMRDKPTMSLSIMLNTTYYLYTIAEFDLKNSNLLPTISISNTLGD